MNKPFFTVQQIADYCEVESQVVLKWLNKDYNKKNPHKVDHPLSLENFSLMIKDSHDHLSNIHNLKPKALIIEDEMNVAKCLSRAFENNGIQSLAVSNAFKAIMLIAKERPNIVTLDLNLVSISGREVLNMIKGLELKHKMWIIIISGETEKKLQEALTLGADFYLEKPFAMTDLEKLILKLHPQKQIKDPVDFKKVA